jgi:hypothetical protein
MAVIIALHPGMALRETVNADRDDGGVARAKRAYREHNWFTLRTTSGLEFTTAADGFNVTEHRSAPASVEVIAATTRAQSILDRADTARDGSATVAGNVSHHDRQGIKRAADDASNDTEPRWAPAGVELAAATEDEESTVERARTARDECVAVADCHMTSDLSLTLSARFGHICHFRPWCRARTAMKLPSTYFFDTTGRAPQLRCLLLEVREQMRGMNARLERIGAHVKRIDARVRCLERRGPSCAPPAGDAPGPFPVDGRLRAMQLLDLPAELLAAIATKLAEDNELAAALACRRLRQAVAGTERHKASARLLTRIGSAFCSVRKLEWAVVSCGLPLRGRLLLRAARAGQLEQLSWLRSRGCAWELCRGDGEDPCSSAAAGGHLTVLQWARADDCPWDYRTCEKAAERAICTCFSGLAPMAATVPVACGHVLCCS